MHVEDGKLVLPQGVRNAGIVVSIAMILLGLYLAWRRSDEPVQLPPTGRRAR